MSHLPKILVGLFGLGLMLSANSSAKAANFKPAPIISEYSDVVDIGKRRYRHRRYIYDDFVFFRSRNFRHNRHYRNRHSRKRYLNRHYQGPGSYRHHGRGHYMIGRDSYDANGFLNEK